MSSGVFMNDQNIRQRGYTLAEVLVALAIFAIIFLAALTAYDRSNRVFKTGVESSNMQQNTRVAFDKLVGDLRMAGYDFDRDGIPTGSTGGTNEYQQPDEQFEYIGPAAMTMRGNFDYETENQPCSATVTDNCDNGREVTYESSEFPVVTTGNDEIVTYALVPDSQTSIPACDPTSNCVQFYADTHIPRRSYPDVPNGGLDENVVEIPGVDLCNGGCNNPPYTLYRFTLDRSATNFTNGANVIRTPLASNIRNMTFKYYQDAQGNDPLKDLANTTDVSTGSTIKGAGQYQVSNPLALVPERDIRSKINSVRITLIGMNESRDAAFTDTAETVTGGPGYFEQYRKYRLETLVSPRNIQKRGMREQDTFPPGAPSGLQVCTGACAGVWMSWAAPTVNNLQGAPDQYKVIYDKDSASGFLCETTTFTNTFGPVFYQPSMSPNCKFDPTVTYKFAVVALNSYGSSTSAAITGVSVLNATQPKAPILTNVTTTLNGKVTLTWNRPNGNFTGNYSCLTAPTVPDPAELLGYVVERETPPGSNTWQPLLPTPTSQVTTTSPFDPVTWTDTTVANCVSYNYRVKAVESCAFNAAWNVSNNQALGTSPYSAVLPGSATTSFAPQAPSNLTVDNGFPTTCYPGPPPPAVPTTLCDVHMFWPPVTLDTATPTPNPVTITTYKIIATPVSAGSAGSQTFPNTTVNASGNVEAKFIGLDIGSAGGQTYNFTVVAHSDCPIATGGTDSAPSPARPYPCPFPAGVVSSPLITSSAFDGDGSPSNPFKIATGTAATANINILSPGSVTAVIGRDYIGTTLNWGPVTCPTAPCSTNLAPAPPFTFSWNLAANTTERFDVTVRETLGCVMQVSAFYEDEPQSCCLLPFAFDPTVVSFSSGSSFVDFVLKNICSQPLTITGLDYTWSNATTPGGTKVDSIFFQTASGGCSQVGFATNCAAFNYGGGGFGAGSDSLTALQIPAGTLTVPAASTRRIRIHFTKTLTNPVQPVTAFTLHYTDASNPGGVSCLVK
jgi:prepilin-type N-terminal cleavage/methylation domain-containing protein